MLERLSIPAANGREPTHRPPPKVRMATKCLTGREDILLSAKSARTRSVLGKRPFTALIPGQITHDGVRVCLADLH